MVDIAVKSGAAWVCNVEGPTLADVLLPVDDEDDSEEPGDEKNCCSPVLLEQMEDGSPCVLSLLCTSSSSIRRLQVISEARTMEVYGETGEYCGTVRGERDDGVQTDSADRGPFYRKQLILESPSSACEVKLLSLAGRSSVLVSRVVVGLRQLQPGPARGPGSGIDLQQVQSLVDEMGTSLSPGAQNLMDMVQFQQKNQTGSLGGFLPLLMGSGALSALAQGANIPTAAFNNLPQPAASRTPAEAPPTQNGGMTNGSTSSSLSSSSTPELQMGGIGTSQVNHAQLAEMMSHFLGSGPGSGSGSTSGPEFLPMLQSVCGQVTKLRLDDAAEEMKMRNGGWELDSAMERRLEEMERRLKEHVDRRLDALEQKLEKALLLGVLTQGKTITSAGGEGEEEETLKTRPTEPSALIPAAH